MGGQGSAICESQMAGIYPKSTKTSISRAGGASGLRFTANLFAHSVETPPGRAAGPLHTHQFARSRPDNWYALDPLCLGAAGKCNQDHRRAFGTCTCKKAAEKRATLGRRCFVVSSFAESHSRACHAAGGESVVRREEGCPDFVVRRPLQRSLVATTVLAAEVIAR